MNLAYDVIVTWEACGDIVVVTGFRVLGNNIDDRVSASSELTHVVFVGETNDRISNDGSLAHQLMHADQKQQKEYRVEVDKLVTEARDLPTASATCWCVKANSVSKRSSATASSIAFKSSR